MRSVEYELTFLAKELPGSIKQAMPTRIVDIYVPTDMSIHPNLRLRKKGSTYEITKKQDTTDNDYSTMIEETIPLSQAEFEALASGNHRLVEKDRYSVNIDGYPAEVDVFSGDLDGLVLIDFEFFDENAKKEFKPPACCLADVTQEDFVAGGLLAGRKLQDLEEKFKLYGYQQLHLQ